MDGSDGGQQVTYSSTTFAVPFDVTLPEWVLPDPTAEEPNFVTWEGSEVDRAIRFLAPISVYPPAAMPSETPSPLPDDYLSYLFSQADYGATFDDVVETTIDGLPTTVVTATTIEASTAPSAAKPRGWPPRTATACNPTSRCVSPWSRSVTSRC